MKDNIGLNDAALLANVLIRAVKDGQDIGDYDYILSNYEKAS
jgi:2-polyprenyl-6-methoxyphenol hydroxylase-like FAD-dependent oxidoreductase